MFYPEDFKARVKKVYPDWEEIHQMLDSGNVYVGRGLDDSSSPAAIHITTILEATSLEELQEKARVLQTKVNLYAEWCRLASEQHIL